MLMTSILFDMEKKCKSLLREKLQLFIHSILSNEFVTTFDGFTISTMHLSTITIKHSFIFI